MNEYLVGAELALYALDVGAAAILQGILVDSVVCSVMNSFALVFTGHEALMGHVHLVALV